MSAKNTTSRTSAGKKRVSPKEKWENSLTIDLKEERHFWIRKGGVLFLDKKINEETFQEFSHDMVYAKLHSPENARKEMLIILNSPGGEVHQAFAMFDLIKAMNRDGSTISILVMGEACSAAVPILQAGAKRLATPHARFLIHQVRFVDLYLEEEEGNYTEERATDIKKVTEMYLKIIANRSGYDLEKLHRETKKTDIWLNAEEALRFGKHGLIDEIVDAIPYPNI